MTKLPFLPIVVIGLTAGGCASYDHTRTLADGSKETTSFRACLMRGKAASIRSSTQEAQYKRTVSVGSIEGETEADKLNSLAESIAKGVAAGLK